MSQLLRKICYSRTNRASPLPVDDDSLLDALEKFIRSIEKNWITNNFSVVQIDSHYNEIISEIKRRNNVPNNSQSGGTQSPSAHAAASTRQKADVLSAIGEAQREWEQKRNSGQGM
jgi:hypothetical protein